MKNIANLDRLRFLEQLTDYVCQEIPKMTYVNQSGLDEHLWYKPKELDTKEGILTSNCLPAHFLAKDYLKRHYSWANNASVVIGTGTGLALGDVDCEYTELLRHFHVWVEINNPNAPLSKVDITSSPGKLNPPIPYCPIIHGQVEAVKFFQDYLIHTIKKPPKVVFKIMDDGKGFFNWGVELAELRKAN
ncbi:hypothetical protein [Vibrio owensii]|uniref:hypothetical protein n=1 Tax=Vibrio owensii TaxID=696485 RepID=UPI00148E6C58|nr:hypothetical protein [Vibrio owensii]NOI73858.1 hypothetical protein [Vibrio owensii]